MSIDHEVRRQAGVLRALWAGSGTPDPLPGEPPWREAGLRLAQGLAAYRGNAQATAERVLISSFPTVTALLGEEAMSVVAGQLWQNHPPRAGDLTLWGQDLPAWLDQLPEVKNWPYLPDCARLDWARHTAERVADTEFEAASLAMLGEADPGELVLQLRPGCSVIPSCWPIVSIWAAHQGGEADVSAMAAALEAGLAENAVVWRMRWRAEVAPLPDPMRRWMQALDVDAAPHERPRLKNLLDQAEPGFDLADWLALALRHGWLWHVSRHPAAA